MLIRPCHRVLNAINYLCSQNIPQTTSSVDLMVYFHQKTKDLDLLETIRQLASEEYITMHDCEKYIDQIALTYKGRHYSQYRWMATKEVIVKSFLLPVAVAFITTILTLIIKGVPI